MKPLDIFKDLSTVSYCVCGDKTVNQDISRSLCVDETSFHKELQWLCAKAWLSTSRTLSQNKKINLSKLKLQNKDMYRFKMSDLLKQHSFWRLQRVWKNQLVLPFKYQTRTCDWTCSWHKVLSFIATALLKNCRVCLCVYIEGFHNFPCRMSTSVASIQSTWTDPQKASC